ncbi:CoA transferase [Hoeflea alexandrii]|uniref:Acyl-CoA transferase n=1 Tax=Hoeflea alexandrii TaxID=288436 RepID=A0ABT1CQK8_9HYPH|nr:CoA transferase [Hoeflea alexandrii]MCO6407661.1 acyl-CoA transferase [Hoeflea alexandrii]MCY0153959.1 CoA transferase [Hoeflea alexandrii]
MPLRSTAETNVVYPMISELWDALGGKPGMSGTAEIVGRGALPSAFAVSDFAAAAVASAGMALAEWIDARSGTLASVTVDRRLASLWFGFSIAPQGWALPPAWDPVAGDYASADGWIRLHTNAPHHREAALKVLGTAAERSAVAAAVARWRGDELEAAIVAEQGCAAAMRSTRQWAEHPQGRAVLAEPLMRMETGDEAAAFEGAFDLLRPLRGLKVLDMTRVLAGPVATRFLAGFGADVLRIDPPSWQEPGVVPEVTPGKRCARLDLKTGAGRERFRALLLEADVVVHGYRSEALEALGLGSEVRASIRPGLIDVSLDAYGWSGPWVNRRGFDSLVQMSCGIAELGMRQAGADRPVPLPVQALDQGAGYLMAAAVLRGLALRVQTGTGSRWRTSLARVGGFLAACPQGPVADPIGKAEPADYAQKVESTDWGPALRLRSPLSVGDAEMHWGRPAGELGASAAVW